VGVGTLGMRSCTRKLEFDAAHRVMRHESKCRNLHGHRYVVEVTASAPELDDLGRVIDFGEIKRIVGSWIDVQLDHGTILNEDDHDLREFVSGQGWKLFLMDCNPTAENMVVEICNAANTLLSHTGIRVTHVRLYETPNCWSDFSPPCEDLP